jgi:hypothetical protein
MMMMMMMMIIIIIIIIEAAGSSEMLINKHQTEWCHISETVTLNYQMRDSYLCVTTGC